jgi:sugar phosphate isomerase/epimerase
MPVTKRPPQALVAAHYTLSGAPANTPARFTFEERVRAVAAAGFTAMGLVPDSSIPMDGLPTLRAIADAHGVAVTEVEFLVNWSLDGPAAGESRVVEEQIYQLADAFGARHMNVGIREGPGELDPLGGVAERFGSLCDRAGEHGLVVAFEFMPFRAIATAAEAWTLVERSGRPNAGIVLDAWHWFRGTPDPAMLRAIPADRVTVVQLCDGAPEPVGSLIEDTTEHRRLPGEGAFDLVGLLQVLDDVGVEAPLSVEILSNELRQLPVDTIARRAHDTAAAVIARAASSTTLSENQ